jgi:glycosyltransferase involved in cell wall biosynthesis
VAKAGALPEIGGEAAVTVDPLDHQALAAAIRRFLTDEEGRKQVVRLGLARAAEFSWERTACETAAVYAAVRARLAEREPAAAAGAAGVRSAEDRASV